MEIKGKVHCMFEQSGTFKKEFIKMGIPAEDYDIQNNFGETDHVMDLFAEIDSAYRGGQSVFGNITGDDLIMAFFPCIYFCGSNNPMEFSWATHTKESLTQRTERIIKRSQDRQFFYEMLLKFVSVCVEHGLRMIFENPYSGLGYLTNNFVKPPSLIDKNRILRGDFFKKPTAYWYFNCEPTDGESLQLDKKQKIIRNMKASAQRGLCSEERSMISPDYARNFICDFILGKPQANSQLMLF